MRRPLQAPSGEYCGRFDLYKVVGFVKCRDAYERGWRDRFYAQLCYCPERPSRNLSILAASALTDHAALGGAVRVAWGWIPNQRGQVWPTIGPNSRHVRRQVTAALSQFKNGDWLSFQMKAWRGRDRGLS
jgi:hypothetical protein